MSENIDKIIEDLARQRFVVFAGAGVVGETGISPSWKRLLEKFKEDEPDSVDENLDEIDETEYPGGAQRIFERLRIANKEHRYYEVLRDGLRATNAPHSIYEVDIVRTAGRIITTNFENTFESALGFELEGKAGCNHKVQRLPILRYDALFERYSVSYIHGSVDEQHVVFKEDDYKNYYPSQFGNQQGSDVLEMFLRYIYTERTIVFIGFGFRDKCLLKALQIIRGNMERNEAAAKKQILSYIPQIENIRHYACMREFSHDAEEKEFRKQFPNKDTKDIKAMVEEKEKQYQRLLGVLGEIGIKVLYYKQHRDWMDWFKRVRENSRGFQTAKFS